MTFFIDLEYGKKHVIITWQNGIFSYFDVMSLPIYESISEFPTDYKYLRKKTSQCMSRDKMALFHLSRDIFEIYLFFYITGCFMYLSKSDFITDYDYDKTDTTMWNLTWHNDILWSDTWQNFEKLIYFSMYNKDAGLAVYGD